MTAGAAAQGPIRVLVVDDVADTRENLMKLLSFEADIEVVGAAPDGRLALESARTLQPDIVLMDITMPTMDGIQAAEMLRAEVPSAQVVMMSVHDESESLRRAMLAGAREFLVKPFGADELVTALRRVAERRKVDQAANLKSTEPVHGSGGKILSVFSPKGGVGRTTIACNLAVALKQATGKRVALVDGNMQFGDIGVVLNVQPTKTIVDLLPHIADIDAELVGDVVLSHSSGVDVLLAPTKPEMAELVTSDYLKRVLAKMREVYDYVVVDTPASFSEAALAALDLSDRIFVLLTVEMPAIKNTRLFLEVASQLGYAREKLTLVLNRADSTGGIEVSEIERSLGHRIPVRIVSDGRLVTYALNQGEPFVLLNKKAAVSAGVNDLAKVAIGTLEGPAIERTAAAVGGLRGLLRMSGRAMPSPVV
ncbi:MAG TPA: response regulator [Chloroflexota bacterium]|jgi:pilus assembly protein CpaE